MSHVWFGCPSSIIYLAFLLLYEHGLKCLSSVDLYCCFCAWVGITPCLLIILLGHLLGCCRGEQDSKFSFEIAQRCCVSTSVGGKSSVWALNSQERRRLFYKAYGIATALLWLPHLNLCCIICGEFEEWVLKSESKVHFLSCGFGSFDFFVVNVKNRSQCGREPSEDWKICY